MGAISVLQFHKCVADCVRHFCLCNADSVRPFCLFGAESVQKFEGMCLAVSGRLVACTMRDYW